MKLVDFINSIKTVNEEFIVFQENRGNFDSDIILSFWEGGAKEEGGREYHYLIEVSLAKEVINDWLASLDYTPTSAEIAKRLYDYAINDA